MVDEQVLWIVTGAAVLLVIVLSIVVGRLWANRRFIVKLVRDEGGVVRDFVASNVSLLDARLDAQTGRLDGLCRDVATIRDGAYVVDTVMSAESNDTQTSGKVGENDGEATV